MRPNSIAALVCLLALGCGPAGRDHEGGSLDHPDQRGSPQEAEQDPQEMVLRGTIRQHGASGPLAAARRDVQIEFGKFYIQCGMGFQTPYARISSATDVQGEFTVHVPPVRGRGTLSYVRITLTPPRQAEDDPTPPAPPPPISSESADGMRVPTPPYLSDVDRFLGQGAVDPLTPSFTIRPPQVGSGAGTETWRRSTRSRTRGRILRQYTCEWRITNVEG